MLESTSSSQWVFLFFLLFGGVLAGWVLKAQGHQLAASVAFGHFHGALMTVALVLVMLLDNPESGIIALAIYPVFTTLGMIGNGIRYKLKSKKSPTVQ